MPIEVWGSDDAGHLMLMPDPSPERTSTATAPGEPPLPREPAPAREAAPPPEPTQADELQALRTMIEAREQDRAAREAKRDARTDTLERLIRGDELTPPADAKPAPPVAPAAEDFEHHEEYVRAAARFETTQALAADRAARLVEQRAEAQRQQLVSRDQSVRTQEDAFVVDHPDYVDVVNKGLVAKAPPEFRQLLMLLDDAPAVAYQVAQDEALLGRLMAMPPGPLFYALGRLSAGAGGGVSAPTATETTPPPEGGDTHPTLGTGPGAPPSPGSTPASSPAGRRLPAPPRPLGGSRAGVQGGYHDDMSQAEYRAWRKAGGL